MCVIQHDEKFCFVLMPFSNDFKNQWDMAFEPAIKNVGLTPFRGDALSFGTNMIMRDVTKYIYEAITIIADISGRNPNVMYELGLAHAAKKDVIMLIQENEDIPFDLTHIRYLKYNPWDLKKLRSDLEYRIKTILQQTTKNKFDFFPEVQLITNDLKKELEYLRENRIPFKIKATPPSADIFFNNSFVGTGSVKLKINENSTRHTISLAALEHYEHHQEIMPDDIAKGEIEIKLDTRDDSQSNFESRVSQWLRFRKKDPDNPVLMRAIIQYLLIMEEFKEAEQEARDLLEVAPTWYMARNVTASVYFDQDNFTEAIRQYKLAAAFRPDHAVGYLGLACAYSLTGKFEEAIKLLEQVFKDQKILDSYKHFGKWKIQDDKDFDPIKEDPIYSKKFFEITQLIENSITMGSN